MRRWSPRLIATGALLCSLSGAAHAASLLVAGVSVAPPVSEVRTPEPRNASPTSHGSPGRAAGLSILATALPVASGVLIESNGRYLGAGAAIALGGIVIGPAAGYYASGLHSRGTSGIALRAGTLLVTGVAAFAALPEGGDFSDLAVPMLVVLAGTTVTTVLAVADCALVSGEVARASRLSVAPRFGGPSGPAAIGVAVRF